MRWCYNVHAGWTLTSLIIIHYEQCLEIFRSQQVSQIPLVSQYCDGTRVRGAGAGDQVHGQASTAEPRPESPYVRTEWIWRGGVRSTSFKVCSTKKNICVLSLIVCSPSPDTANAPDQLLVLQASGNELSTKTAISLLLLIFCSSILAMGLVWKTFPDMNPEDQESIKFPKDLNDAKKLGQVLSRYKEQYFAQVCYKQVFISMNRATTKLKLVGVCWICLCLHISANIRHPRFNISVHYLWISVSLSSGIICSLFLLSYRLKNDQ